MPAPAPAGELVVPAAFPPVELVGEPVVPLAGPEPDAPLLGWSVLLEDEAPLLGEVVLGEALEVEALPLGAVLGEVLEDDEALPLGGVLGVVVLELELELGLLGVVVAEPERLVVSVEDDEPEVAPRSGPRSQP